MIQEHGKLGKLAWAPILESFLFLSSHVLEYVASFKVQIRTAGMLVDKMQEVDDSPA